MKKEVSHNSGLLKQILCFSSVPQSIAVTEEMVDNLIQESKATILITACGENINDVISNIKIDNGLNAPTKKVIILIRTSENYSISLLELSEISAIVDSFPTNCEIAWGTATSKEQDNNVNLIIAIPSK